MLWICYDTVGDRAHGLARGCVIVAFTFCATIRVNFIREIAHGDRFVRTFWIAHVAVNAFFGDQ